MKFDPSSVPCSYVPRLFGLMRIAEKDSKKREDFKKLLSQGQEELSNRLQNTFDITYPSLPVSEKKDEIKKMIQNNQVCIIQGDTGSGKTTQIPKMCMELGLGYRGIIGCTQPRRIAALSIADRLREETGQDNLIGHKIRFLEECPDDLHVKVMTDGILLQEFKNDRFLNQYSCIILDEAHERSLNIDILLGILKTLLAKRRDLKLIITSATIDAEHFSNYFNKAPILKVEGRMFPVEVEYWDTDEIAEEYGLEAYSITDATIDAIKHIQAQVPDNLLAFLPTEKDIHEVEKGLDKIGNDFVVLPLYGRLSPQEQKKIFAPSLKKKIVLATNIAETSLTIPGIAYVVDSGYARVSRFCTQTHIQGLPIEKISRASADQRKGRAGRVKPGVCIRLYSQEDFDKRAEYTEPEILRSNLANVLLQLLNTGLNPHIFEFLAMPADRSIKAGFRLLYELGAISDISEKCQLTPLGRSLSTIPVDVTIGRIMLAAKEKNVLSEVVAIAAAISIQDPRIRPSDDRERSKADGLHSRFSDKKSDFISLLKIWDFVNAHWKRGESLNKLRKLCNENYLHYLRIREWRDLFEQFCHILQIKPIADGNSVSGVHHDSLHQSILSGFLHNIAERHQEGHGYKIARHPDAYIFPGSGLFNKKPQWLVASEVRETTRVFLVGCAQIEPDWILEYSKHLCNYSYYNVMWNEDRGFVEAREKVSFKGFCVRYGNRVNYESINPEECAEIFWRDGIVTNPRQSFGFKKINNNVLKEMEELEKRSRTWGLVPSEEQVTAWYIQQFPEITSLHKLKKYIQQHGEKPFCFNSKTWLEQQVEALPAKSRETITRINNLDIDFPSTISLATEESSINYQFDFGTDLDGACVKVTPNQAAAVNPGMLFEAIPGWGNWILKATIESLPKASREIIEEKQAEIHERWKVEVAHHPDDSVAASLFTTLRVFKEENMALSLPSKWEQHHIIHLRIKAVKVQLPLDITPGDTSLTIANKLRALFYLDNWLEERGKPFSYRVFKCYKQLPPRLHYLNTILVPLNPDNIEGTFTFKTSSFEGWYTSIIQNAGFELRYNKKYKNYTDVIDRVKQLISSRVQAIAGIFNSDIIIPQHYLEAQAWQILKDRNLAKATLPEILHPLESSITLPKLKVSSGKKKLKSLSQLHSTTLKNSDAGAVAIHTLISALTMPVEIFTALYNAISAKCNVSDFSDFAGLDNEEIITHITDSEPVATAAMLLLLHRFSIDSSAADIPEEFQKLEDISSFIKHIANIEKEIRNRHRKKRDDINALFERYGVSRVVLNSDIKKALFALEERGDSLDEALFKELKLDVEVNKALQSFFQKPHAFTEEFGQAESIEKDSLASLRKSFGRIR